MISRDLCGDLIGYLDIKEGRDAFDRAIPSNCRFLVLDNLSALTSGGREDAGSWAEIKQWLIQKRPDGIAVLIIHHAGKNGSQRGSSAHQEPREQFHVDRFRKSECFIVCLASCVPLLSVSPLWLQQMFGKLREGVELAASVYVSNLIS